MKRKMAAVLVAASMLIGVPARAGVILTSVYFEPGFVVKAIDPYRGRAGERLTITFDAPIDYADYQEDGYFEADYYAFTAADRTTSAEVYPFGNEARTTRSIFSTGEAITFEQGGRGTLGRTFFGPEDSPWAMFFPFGGFVRKQQRYLGGQLDVGSQNGVTALFTATTAVPEPATWAMMIGGIGLVGGTLRRRAGRGGTSLSRAAG